MTDDRKHKLLRLAGTTDAMQEHELRNDLFNLAARTEAQFNQRGDTIIEESMTITPDDFERFKPEFDKLRKMFKVSEHETTLPDGKMVRVVTWVSHQQPTITMWTREVSLMNTCRKGKRVEREAAKFLTAHGIPAERGARNGVKDGQDLILPPEYDIHIEVKGDQSVRPGTKAMEKALDQARDGAIKAAKSHACVLWKEDRKGWRTTYCQNWKRGEDNHIAEITLFREIDIVRYLRNKSPA